METSDAPDFILAVRFFQSERGIEPVRDWLRSLPPQCRKSIGEDIKTVQYGWPIGMPLVRKLDKGLWEVRSHIPDGIARVMFMVEDNDMVLLHGFIKKKQQMPLDELQTAQNRKRLVERG